MNSKTKSLLTALLMACVLTSFTQPFWAACGNVTPNNQTDVDHFGDGECGGVVTDLFVKDNSGGTDPITSLDGLSSLTFVGDVLVIRELPQGYDTMIGERGAGLSGGERQRQAIVRALLKDTPVLILDEPNSALDTETETRMLAGRTMLVFAHLPSTIRYADQTVVLKQGKIDRYPEESRL